jgi:hypothetical protein
MALVNETNLRNFQNRVFYYRQELKSEEFNRTFSKTLPSGVYDVTFDSSGKIFTYINNTTFLINPFSVVIEDRNGRDLAVRIRLTDVLTATISGSLDYPLVVARFEWIEDSESHLNILQVSETKGTNDLELNPTDIILGKINLIDNSGSGVINTNRPFDFTVTQYSPIINEILQNRFMVKAPKGADNQKTVSIEGGSLRVRDGNLVVSGGYSPVISDTGTTGRLDYVYIDTDGSFLVEEGDSAGNLRPFYGRKVLAIISRGASRTDISGEDIINLHSTPLGTLEASTLEIKNNEGYYLESTTIEDALKEVWEKATRQVLDETLYKIFRNSNGTYFERASDKNKIRILGPTNGTGSFKVTITSNDITGDRLLTLVDGNTTLSSGTMVNEENEQTVTGRKTFRNADGITIQQAVNQDGIVLKGRAGGTNNYKTIISPEELTANRNITLPDGDLTLLPGSMVTTEDTNQTVDGIKTFSKIPVLPDEDPTTDNQAVRKKFLEDHKNSTSPHSATATDTPDRLVLRDSSGRAKIKAPAVDLDISNKKYVDDTNNATLASTDSSLNTKLTKSAGATEKLTGTLYTQILRPDNTGSRDIGTDAVKYKDGYFTGVLNSGSFNSTSSREKKKDIEDYNDSGLKIIDSLQIVSFIYKDDKNEQSHIGIIAEDCPKEILGLEGKSLSLSDSIGVLFKAVQELSNKVKELERKLEEK